MVAEAKVCHQSIPILDVQLECNIDKRIEFKTLKRTWKLFWFLIEETSSSLDGITMSLQHGRSRFRRQRGHRPCSGNTAPMNWWTTCCLKIFCSCMWVQSNCFRRSFFLLLLFEPEMVRHFFKKE